MHRAVPLLWNAGSAVLLLGAAACARDGKAGDRWRFADVAPPLVQPHVMAVSDNPASSAVGADIMRRGGNAIDAIVAVAFAQAVVNPAAGNLGGGGFLVYRQHDGEVFALDFREAAPLAATRDMYVDSAGKVGDGSLVGARAGGVPGSVAGLWAMHKRFGQLPWREVVLPAVALAQAHVLDSLRAEWLAGNARTFALFPSSAAIFLRDRRPTLARRRHALPGRPRPHAHPGRRQRRRYLLPRQRRRRRLRARCSAAAGSSRAKTSRSTRRSGARRSRPPIADGA